MFENVPVGSAFAGYFTAIRNDSRGNQYDNADMIYEMHSSSRTQLGGVTIAVSVTHASIEIFSKLSIARMTGVVTCITAMGPKAVFVSLLSFSKLKFQYSLSSLLVQLKVDYHCF